MIGTGDDAGGLKGPPVLNGGYFNDELRHYKLAVFLD